MSENPLEAIERLEKLAAWHRINAERAGADWVWEARLRTAEDLERRAAKIRGQLSSRDSAEVEIAALPGHGREASDDIANVNRRTGRRIASSAALPTSRLRQLSADAKKSRRRSHTKAVIREAKGPERRIS
jgi:DNA-binding winged helix-turn-helix (wHTH) protein